MSPSNSGFATCLHNGGDTSSQERPQAKASKPKLCVPLKNFDPDIKVYLLHGSVDDFVDSLRGWESTHEIHSDFEEPTDPPTVDDIKDLDFLSSTARAMLSAEQVRMFDESHERRKHSRGDSVVEGLDLENVATAEEVQLLVDVARRLPSMTGFPAELIYVMIIFGALTGGGPVIILTEDPLIFSAGDVALLYFAIKPGKPVGRTSEDGWDVDVEPWLRNARNRGLLKLPMKRTTEKNWCTAEVTRVERHDIRAEVLAPQAGGKGKFLERFRKAVNGARDLDAVVPNTDGISNDEGYRNSGRVVRMRVAMQVRG